MRLVAWRPSQNEVFEWKELGAEYAVSAAGALSIPLIGEIEVDGLTTVETGRRVSKRFQERLDLAQAPDVSVEVVRYRPFYILGDVANPGEYAYRPDFNVIKAITVAGGIQAGVAGDRVGARRDRINGAGQLRELMAERTSLLAQRARLQATLDKKKEIEFPAALLELSLPLAKTAMGYESSLFYSIQQMQQTRTAQLSQTNQLLQKRLAFLNQQIEKNIEFAAVAQKEQGDVSDNFTRGITSQQRLMATRRQSIEADIQTLRLRAEALATDKEIQQIGAELAQTEANLRKETLTDLGSVSARLERINHQIVTAATMATGTVPGNSSTQSATITVEILRGKADAVATLAGQETTLVLPGDTIKVSIPAPSVQELDASIGLQAPPPFEKPNPNGGGTRAQM